MFGNAKFRWFLLAPIVLALLVVASPASAKEFLIADVYFDDGSVLHDAEFINFSTGHPKIEYYKDKIKVKHENEFFNLNFEDLKAISFEVKLGTDPLFGSTNFRKQTIITLKIKTKTGVVINDRFSLGETRYGSDLRENKYCKSHSFSFVNKLTGEKTMKFYRITNLTQKTNYGGKYYCVFTEHETKAISSIVFKDS